jgi:hypothetical protein
MKTKLVKYLKTPGKSELMNFLIQDAILPKNIEFNNLTKTTKLTHSMVSEMMIKIRPINQSGILADLNRNTHSSGIILPWHICLIRDWPVSFPRAISSNTESSN